MQKGCRKVQEEAAAGAIAKIALSSITVTMQFDLRSISIRYQDPVFERRRRHQQGDEWIGFYMHVWYLYLYL